MEGLSFNQHYKGSVILSNDCRLIFMPPKLIEIMQEYNGPIFIDGTFKCCPPLCDGLVSLRIEYKYHFIPAAYFIMTSRKEQLYTLALANMK